MRLIALGNLKAFWSKHPETKSSLERWVSLVKQRDWKTSDEVQSSFSKAKVLNSERIRFEVGGGDYRLIAAFDFDRGLVFVKFIGTHNEYDRIDALNVVQF
jgi:mRNA interferase HigB